MQPLYYIHRFGQFIPAAETAGSSCLFIKSINYACLILGIITLVAIIPAYIGSEIKSGKVKTELPKN
jgi:hypothetical protein